MLISQQLERAGKQSELDGFWVQAMAPDEVELMFGVTHGPLFGPLISCGLGGMHVEILLDARIRVGP